MKKILAANSKPGELILGVDPGLSMTGWGLVSYSKGGLAYVNKGSISTKSSDSLPKRLNTIYKEIMEVMSKEDLKAVAIENFFVGINCKTTIQTVHARGVLLLALGACGNVGEYSPNKIKKRVTGEGHANKDQVEFQVRARLGIDKNIKLNSHESDALAVAICHVETGGAGFTGSSTSILKTVI